MKTTLQVQLAARPGPEGPALQNFALCDVPLRAPGAGEVLLETLYLSLDPYMRARMYEGANYAASAALGAPMPGATIARVGTSNADGFAPGDLVESAHGWQSHHVASPDTLRPIPDTGLPVTTELGVLGMAGHTGYGGLLRYGRPQKGETVLVSAASGAVGSVVGQVARIKGCRVIGIASGEQKCRYLTDELGFDVALDRRDPWFDAKLAAACETGIDVYFDNVGGEIFAATIPLLNTGARIAVCGTISVDRNQPPAQGTDRLTMLHSAILVKQLSLQGFLYTGLLDMTEAFRRDMTAWIASGELRYREDIVDGLENAPEAFLRLFTGENFGKSIVRVAHA
ncbi:NADP-dependent oxidoreductase [Rhodobacter sp. NTK016B]|uniref:NADP-dependent oxidoreductase n=1 Tax=Rhodobacter sp. NTK016B TaxID=2759676 RepID=UPI001A8EE38D|nr:NADP-dependent oxidoreductase [Rhodobacter sp. NTK016B]MBN8291191.1 NADP-dependent oxidoreductase [Rhodobacter sp. NTK016B]